MSRFTVVPEREMALEGGGVTPSSSPWGGSGLMGKVTNATVVY